MNANKNMRTLAIAKILQERTDEEHPLSTNQLMEILQNEYGISAHRVTVYEDIEQLRSFGLDIYTVKSTQNKFITEKKSQVLTEKLTSLASKNQALSLKRNICLADRVKSGNEQIYYIMDALNDAINSGYKVRFLYYEFSAGKRKKLKNNGEPYYFSPYTLTWNGDNYYVVGWSDKHQKVATFRVDRIYQIPEILPEAAVPKPKKFSIGEFAEKASDFANKATDFAENVKDGVVDLLDGNNNNLNTMNAEETSVLTPTF